MEFPHAFRLRRLPASLTFLITALITAVCVSGAAPASAQAPLQIEPASMTPYAKRAPDMRTSDFSGLPVPRYASLKYGDVNGRMGPSREYPVRWRYERQGLPVLVVRESGHWRKVRDPQGDEVWVHQRMLGVRRTGMTAENAVLYARADDSSQPIAEVSVGVVTDIAECEGDWCRISISDHKGWLRRLSIWGVDDMQ